MKKAREERERVKKFTERGIHLNDNSSKILPPTSPAVNHKRPQTSTHQSAQKSRIN